MSVSYEIKGLLEPDEKFEEMKEIWNLCKKNNIDIPDEVIEYFHEQNPLEGIGMEIDIRQAVEILSYDTTVIYQIDLKKVPSHMRYVRFCCSY